MNQLTERFSAWVCRNPDRANAAHVEMGETVQRAGLLPVDQQILAHPVFLTGPQVAALETDISQLFQVIMQVPDRLFGGDVRAMCRRLGFGPVETAAIEATWEDHLVLLGRADMYEAADGFKLLEFNVHSSTGGISNSDFLRTLLRIPFYREFVEEEGLTYTDTMEGVATELWRAARQRGLGGRPTIAVIDWHTSYAKLADMMSWFSHRLTEYGFDAFPCHIRQVECRDGFLYRGDRRIDILYRTFVIDDLKESPEDLQPVLEAYRNGNLLLAMTFAAELVGNKGTLALLSEATEHETLQPKEHELIRRYVPWTRFVESGTTRRHGEEHDMTRLLVERQADFILKPVVGYAGHGVTPGWVTSAEDWRHLVEQALSGPIRYVVQDRVIPRTEWLPRLGVSGISWGETAINWGVFVARDQYNGVYIRGGFGEGEAVINVAQGAAWGGCFHSPRPVQ